MPDHLSPVLRNAVAVDSAQLVAKDVDFRRLSTYLDCWQRHVGDFSAHDQRVALNLLKHKSATLSRFLTDSETLDRVLKIALSVRNGESTEGGASEPKFPDKTRIDEFVELARGSDRNAAAARLADLAGISQANADRIMADREGEPMSVVLKALGLSRARFAEVIDEFRQSPLGFLHGSRNITDLQSIFDSLSFNKARMLLTYWDWAVQHSGPYARNGK